MDRLQEIRGRIDDTDRQILLLLSDLMKQVKQIGEIKKRMGIPVHQSSRWKKVLSNRKKVAKKLGLSQQWITLLWECIHAEAILVEEGI